MLQIIPIPALTDNYIWIMISVKSRHCIIVDPGESQHVIDAISLHQLTPVAIFITHHHHDHTGGLDILASSFNIPVFGHRNITGVTRPVADGEEFNIKKLEVIFKVLSIPGHTLDHTAFYSPYGIVFTGDTLFTGACGKLFEGTATQMYDSLGKLAALPEHTLIYCGHEYTEKSLKFALHIEPNNETLQARIRETNLLRKHGVPTVPAPLFLEKQTNPFLRCHEPAVIQAAERYEGHKLFSPDAVFANIRKQKDVFV